MNSAEKSDLVAYEVAKYKVKSWIGGMANYTSQTTTSSGDYNSMNTIEAKAKGLESQKIVADLSFSVAPIAEETNVAADVLDEIKLNDNASIGVGAEIGT